MQNSRKLMAIDHIKRSVIEVKNQFGKLLISFKSYYSKMISSIRSITIAALLVCAFSNFAVGEPPIEAVAVENQVPKTLDNHDENKLVTKNAPTETESHPKEVAREVKMVDKTATAAAPAPVQASTVPEGGLSKRQRKRRNRQLRKAGSSTKEDFGANSDSDGSSSNPNRMQRNFQKSNTFPNRSQRVLSGLKGLAARGRRFNPLTKTTSGAPSSPNAVQQKSKNPNKQQKKKDKKARQQKNKSNPSNYFGRKGNGKPTNAGHK